MRLNFAPIGNTDRRISKRSRILLLPHFTMKHKRPSRWALASEGDRGTTEPMTKSLMVSETIRLPRLLSISDEARITGDISTHHEARRISKSERRTRRLCLRAFHFLFYKSQSLTLLLSSEGWSGCSC